MQALTATLLILLVTPCWLSAADLPSKVVSAEKRFAREVASVMKDSQRDLDDALDDLRDELADELKDATKDGDLELALVIKKRLEQIEDPQLAYKLLLHVHDSLVDVATIGGSKIPDDAITIGNHRYHLFDQQLTWHEAEAACRKIGGRLAILSDRATFDRVAQYVRDKQDRRPFHAWLGATSDNQGNIHWTDGSAVDSKLPNDFAKKKASLTNRFLLMRGVGDINLETADQKSVELFLCQW
ncbi:MAG: C-type lectin domain-containing protein [Planctomycetota bacterium]|jgi:hypothetical protein